MFKKMMKGGHKKPSKSDSNDPPPSGNNRNSAAPVIVNHGSRGSASTVNSGVVMPLTPSSGTMEPVPLFRDVPVSERQNIFLRKLHVCCFSLDFTDTLKSVREKEIKRQALIELVEFIQSGSGKISENCQEEMIRMISINIFRCLPPASHENTGTEPTDPEEEEPCLEPAWPHLQLVYELLLRYVVSSDTDTKVAKRYIDHSFVLKLLDLFDSEDPREREYLKTILHRIYGKFMVHRPFIRKAINNIFYRFIYETERHCGIGELLEILGSIINGFALPMKEEHKLFLVRALLPLHKPKSVVMYHQQLSYCITQFVEKDFKLADTVIRGLLKYWPVTNCQKEILFLGELEEVLEATQNAEFQRCMVQLFKQISRCLNSSFQVAERALFLWNNEHIVSLIAQNRTVILPIIFEAFERNIESHWNQAVHGLTVNVRKMFIEMDGELFEECQRNYVLTELKDLVKLCRWEQDKSYSSIENLKKSRQKLKKLIKKHTDILQEPMDKLIRDVLHKGSISGVSDLPLFSDENRLIWFENCSMALDHAFQNLLLKKTSAFDVLLLQQKNANEVGSTLRSCDSQRTLYQEGWKDVWHMIENIYIKAVDSGNIWKEDKNNQRKSRALSDLLNLLKTSGLSQRKSTHKDERKPWWFLQLSGNMECLLLENSRFASPSLEIDGKVKNKDAPEESPLTEWKTAIEHYFKSVMCVRLLQEEICLDPHKDIAPQQVTRSSSFLSQLVQIQQDQLAAASVFSEKLKCFREFATTMGKLFSFSSPTDNSKSYMCSIVPPNQLATYKCMWQQKQLFDSLCATSNGELLLLRILENSHLNTCQRTRPSASEMTASIEEFLPVFCKSKESLDCYLIGGSKAVTTIASSHLSVVTQEMEQLVSENFKVIKDFKDHFLVLQANGMDRSSVKNVLIHHFQEIIDKAKSIEEEFITAKNENSNPVDSSEKDHFCGRQCAEPNARFDEALKSTYQHITSVLQSLCSPSTIPSMINLGSWELQFVANLSLDMLCDDLFKTITFGAKLVNCCDNNISSSSKVGAHFQNLHTLVDLLLKFSGELLKNFFAMHKSVAVTTHVIANILVSLFSKGFGRLTENQEDDGTLDKSEDASGTGMGEGVGLNDVSDQITDEDQLLGTREQKKEEQEESKEVAGNDNTGIEMDQDFQADAVSLSEDSSENEDCDGENEELESEMGPTGPDSEAVGEKIWDQNEDETPDDTGEKYESGPSVKDGDGSNKELRAKDDSTSDQSGGDSCDEGDAQNDEAAAQNEFDDEENGDDVNMDKEAAHSDATGLKPDEPDHSSDMEIDLNANEDVDPIEEGDQEGHDDSAENGNQEDETCPPDEIMEEAHTEVDVSSEKDDLGQEHQENDDMNSLDPKNDTSESSDVVNPQVSNVDLASQSKSDLQTSGSENIASQSNLSNSHHDFGNPAVTGGFPSSDMSEMDINMSDSSNTGGFSKTQPKSHLPQHEHSFSQEKQTNPSRSTGDALDFRKEKINVSGDLPEDNIEHHGEMDDNNADEYGYVSEFEKGTTQALGPATLEQVDRNIDVDKVDTESRAGEDANLQLEKQNSEIDSVSNSSLLPKNEKRDQANMPVMEKSQDDGSVKPLGSANIDPESHLEDLISINRSYLGENTHKLSQLSVNDEELGKYHEPCDAPDHVKDNATALWRRYELSTTKLSQELTEQLRLVLEPTVASKLQGYYKTGKRIHMKKVIQFIASYYRMDKIWLRRTRPNKRDYQVVIAVDDSHSMSESCCGDVAVEALVTVCRAVSQLEMGSLAVASFGTKGNINLLHDFDSPFTAESGVKMVSNLTFKQENTIADEPVVDLLKFLTNKLDAAVVKARLPSGHNPLQQLVLIIADGRFHEKDNLKRCVREALASNRMVAFLLLDNSQESIMDLMEASFEGGKMKFSKYMDSFPFPYYIVLRNIEALPRTLANLLRQWLELMQHSNY